MHHKLLLFIDNFSNVFLKTSQSDDFFKGKTNSEVDKAKSLDIFCKVIRSLCAVMALHLLLRGELQVEGYARN